MLSYSFFAHFIFCLLLCLLSYCATSSQGISVGGGFLEVQILVCIPCFIALPILRRGGCSRPRDGSWNDSGNSDRLHGSCNSQRNGDRYRRPYQQRKRNKNEFSGELRNVRAETGHI